MCRVVTVLIMTFCLCGSPALTFESSDFTSSQFRVDSVSVFCDALQKEVAVKILVPVSQQWNDEAHVTVYALDSRSDGQLAKLVAGFVSSHDAVLPMLIVRPIWPNSTGQEAMAQETGLAIAGFLKDRVLPLVEDKYRTLPFRLLLGDQLDGTTTGEVRNAMSGIFHGIVATRLDQLSENKVDLPSLSGLNGKEPDAPMSVFFVSVETGSAGEALSSVEKTMRLPDGINVKQVVLAGNQVEAERVPAYLLHRGLEYCFEEWLVLEALTDIGLSGIQEHFEGLGKNLGITVPVPQRIVDRLAREWFAAGNYIKGLEALRYNARKHPDSAGARAAVGLSLFGNRRFQLAAVNFKDAVEIAERTGHPGLVQYRDFLDRAYKEMNGTNLETHNRPQSTHFK